MNEDERMELAARAALAAWSRDPNPETFRRTTITVTDSETGKTYTCVVRKQEQRAPCPWRP